MKIPQKNTTMLLPSSTSTMRRRARRRKKLIRRLALLAISSGLLAACVLSAYQWDLQTTVEEPATKEVLTTSQTPDNTPTAVEITPIPSVQPTIESEPEPLILNCKLTAYCIENYPHRCNDGDSTYTATMTNPTPGRTIAVDPKVIPLGSEVIIDGHTYIAEDTGGAIKGNRIDIVFETHQEALEFGVRYAEVEVK